MKKKLSVFMILLTVFLLSACGTKNEKVFATGTIMNNVYVSQFAGFRFTAPSGWYFVDEKDYRELASASVEMVANEYDADKDSIEQLVITDALCASKTSGDNIIIQYNNLAKEVPNPNSITTEYFMEEVEKMLLSADFMSFKKVGNTEKITLGEGEFLKAHYSTSVSGETFHQYMYLRKEGGYIIQMNVTLMSGSTNIEDIENCFSSPD